MKLIDYIAAIFVRILNLIFHFIPTGFTLWLGRQVGTLLYLANTDRRAIGYANLRAAFCKEKKPKELKRLIKGVYQSLVETVFEILTLTKVNKKYIEKYVEIINAEDKYKLTEHPHGVILLAAHFGNWELSAMTCAIKGFPPVVLAREQSMKKMNALINRLRESKGLQVVTKGITTRYIVKALHHGKIIGMVGDQDAGKTGVFVDFFGRPASTAPGTARIAAKTGAYIVPAFMVRVKGPYHRAILEEAIKIEKKEDITPYLARYNKLLEKYVREYPTQWLWLHRRWKTSPLKRITVLSDGRAGHLNQALAVVKQLKKYREDSEYKIGDTDVEIIEVKFKNRFTKMFLGISGLFSTARCQGCMRCLRFSLQKDAYERLMKRHSDIVISCGAGVAVVNRFFSIENNAKSACVMRPPLLGPGKFDMLILPQHDRVKNTKEGRIIVTDTVPNLIDEKYMEDCVKEVLQIAHFEKKIKLGVLLGGDNSGFALTEDITLALLENVIDASKKIDADILFTTSRRTPAPCERLAKEKLHPEKRSKFLVMANEKNFPHAVGGILGLSDIIVVSCESASMISEAISSGKTVIVFRLKSKKKSKFEKMLTHLAKKGYITIVEAEGLSDAICRNFHKPEPKNSSEDAYNIYKYMWRLGV